MNIKDFLDEYGMKSGPPTPVGQQPNVNHQQKKSPNKMMDNPPAENTSDIDIAKEFANRKPQQRVMKTKTANLERDQIMRDQDGTDLGVIVSKVGEQPNPDSVVALDAEGEMVAFDPDEEVYVSENLAIFNKFDKLPLREQLRVMNDVDIEQIEEALKYKKHKQRQNLIESALPDSTRIKTLQEILSDEFPAYDLKKQMYAYWAIPTADMLKDFAHARAYQGNDICLRPILKDYIRNKLSKEEIAQIGKAMVQ